MMMVVCLGGRAREGDRGCVCVMCRCKVLFNVSCVLIACSWCDQCCTSKTNCVRSEAFL